MSSPKPPRSSTRAGFPRLRRSRQLTAGNYGDIVVFAIYVGLIVTVPTLLVGFAFGHRTTTVASFLVGVLLQIATWSFGALAAGLLYFDLRARLVPAAIPKSAPERVDPGSGPSVVSHSWDPDSYEDQDRPKGWYVDPMHQTTVAMSRKTGGTSANPVSGWSRARRARPSADR